MIPEVGAKPLCFSVGHLGPITTCVMDSMLLYGVLAGPDPRDPFAISAAPKLLTAGDIAHISQHPQPLRGLKIGVYWPWWNHSDKKVANACRQSLDYLTKEKGAELIEIEIPYLEQMRVAHVVTILSEMLAGVHHYHSTSKKEMGMIPRLALRVTESIKGSELVQAQKIKTLAINIFRRLFNKVDVILTPTVACTVPKYADGDLSQGISDVVTVSRVMRYMAVGNLVGIPAISVPCGYDDNGMPIGLQIQCDNNREDLLFKTAMVAEQFLHKKKPKVFYDILT